MENCKSSRLRVIRHIKIILVRVFHRYFFCEQKKLSVLTKKRAKKYQAHKKVILDITLGKKPGNVITFGGKGGNCLSSTDSCFSETLFLLLWQYFCGSKTKLGAKKNNTRRKPSSRDRIKYHWILLLEQVFFIAGHDFLG